MSLAGGNIINLNLIEQRFGLQLRVQNSDRFALPVRGMDFVLQLHDRDFARCVTNQPATIQPLGDTLVNVNVISNLVNSYEQMRE